MSNKQDDSRTIFFDSVPEENSGVASKKSKLVICIFMLIALIAIAFVVLVIGKAVSDSSDKNKDKEPDQSLNYISVPQAADQIHVGNLLVVSKEFKYNYKLNADNNIVSVYESWKKDSSYLYSLVTTEGILLSSEALEKFSQMLSDYSAFAAPATNINKTNISLAWGYSNESVLEDDVKGYGETFYDNATGNTLTIRQTDPNQAINESLFKSEYTWLYDNMHKYGFIIRYPNDKEASTGFNSKARVHLRYVGAEHATYMKENNLCLEEYLAKIRTEHKYESSHLEFSANEKAYEVYYVKAEGNPVSVPVPKDGSYYISGDNMNGFIVTVTK